MPPLDRAIEVLRGARIAVLTGAGVSTDSGIPDYRGRGAPVRAPMSFAQFLSDERSRRRYWAGSHLGWRRFSAARPNDGHRAIVELEAAGIVAGVVTQNVDGLHVRAGSRRVVDLHGSMSTVRCLRCGQGFAREDVAARLTAANPWLAEAERRELAPDGDVPIDDHERMAVPGCSVCGGVLKPDVVFFGELVPRLKHAEASALISAAGALLVAGSSLAVNSGIRMLELARRRGMPVVIVNRGETKGDARAAVKVDAGATETLVALRDALA